MRIRPVQGHDDPVLGVRLQLLNGLQGRLHGRFRLFAGVIAYRSNDVARIKRLAIVERHVLPEIEDPGCRGIAGFPGFRQLGHEIARFVDLNELTHQICLGKHPHLVRFECRVE